MSKKRSSGILKLVFLIIAVVLVIAAIVAIILNIDTIKSLVNNFSVTIDDVKYTGTNIKNANFSEDKNCRVYIKDDDYTVKIVGLAGLEFDFLIDGEVAGFSAIKDFTSVFEIEKYDGYFTFNASLRMYDILSRIYPESKIKFIDPQKYFDVTCCFVMKIFLEKSKNEMIITLNNVGLFKVPVGEIDLSDEIIILR